jgi:hypothetical protein
MIGGNMKWNKELVLDFSKKCQSIQDLKKNYPRAYRASVKYGWIHELNLIDNRPKDWKSKKVILEEAKKYSTIKEFTTNNRPAYNAAKRLGILDRACKHMKKLKRNRDEVTIDEMISIAKKYNKRTDLLKNDSYIYIKASKLGILDKLFAHL